MPAIGRRKNLAAGYGSAVCLYIEVPCGDGTRVVKNGSAPVGISERHEESGENPESASILCEEDQVTRQSWEL